MARNWDKELAKIDKQLESLSDESLLPVPAKPAPAPVQAAASAPVQEAPVRRASRWAVIGRLALATALGVGMVFWPYSTTCGLGLFAYLGAIGVLVAAGTWSAAASWRQRFPTAHVLSLLVIAWGGVLAAAEILPRTGYAIPSEVHPAQWMCP